MDGSNTQFYTGFNYQKGYLQDSQIFSIPVSSPGPPASETTVTVTHNLGRIGSYRVWFDPALSRRYPVNQFSAANFVSARVHATLNTLVFEVVNLGAGTTNVIFYYRIYYDAN